MQYRHRKLHRSVTEIRKSLNPLPNRSSVKPMPHTLTRPPHTATANPHHKPPLTPPPLTAILFPTP
jgi:hypothetical protein